MGWDLCFSFSVLIWRYAGLQDYIETLLKACGMHLYRNLFTNDIVLVRCESLSADEINPNRCLSIPVVEFFTGAHPLDSELAKKNSM